MPVELPPPTVQELIEQYSEEYQVPYFLAYELARYESNFIPTASNKKSSAKGVYQWIDSSWDKFCEGDVMNAEDNISCTMRVISEGGLSHWLADWRVRKQLWNSGFITCSDFWGNKCRLDYN